jgi:Zn-dependent protease
MGSLGLSTIQKIAIYVIPLIFAITVHEYAHGYVAYKNGDPTAKFLGRLTLNPINHIDPIGTVLFPLIGIIFGGFIFGWAKPVPVNFGNLRNPKRDMLWVSLAGPGANFAMALIWALILKFSNQLPTSYFAFPLSLMSQAGISINISLMLLNLIPILPLDGGRILFSLLPRAQALKYSKIEPYGMWILILLIITGALFMIIRPFYSVIVSIIYSLIQ